MWYKKPGKKKIANHIFPRPPSPKDLCGDVCKFRQKRKKFQDNFRFPHRKKLTFEYPYCEEQVHDRVKKLHYSEHNRLVVSWMVDN